VTVNRTDIVAALAEKAQVTKEQADAVLTAFTEVIGESLAKGEKVQLTGFLTAEAVARAERTGRNPRTGEELVIPASTGVKLSAGSKLKAAVSG
jgi:DNA-binding protein HU-beta